ncbi:TPA: RNA-binding domain-containing protein [Vibrio parahaemolyticus]|uniref:RNA-binding domain-containing protein n=1 Tax=Vibrio parahaemolyticus TaxID=670 RepID=UPI001A8D1089|nr:RNA-binding domain-containing protein [Vibrio parahaemolyticus]MBO0156017.1 putative DNA binding domain-containing protein [Vibrio parahaemolyticus]MBO0171592.1 putative DNA binding domain-containing protein [Vibrio parahaemolyticus]MCX8857413.1 putative DNA binding domain-containing protein [Vibrio parahaemolyticus]MCX8861220.1 putative DNA binding domain-containing protein [Vibrio parahaemolyticus]MCX8867950.1 putative DNA binding domain-containing protein [Vibrio parahaemolyticus]
MFQIQDLVDLQTLSESAELEFKLAQGQDGKGKLPDDFWPTYSAMANSRGGYVVLGVREKKGQLTLAGIEAIEVVRKQLFDIAGNNAKVNINLLTDDNVQVVSIDGKSLLVIEIPAARRDQKPVYLKNQPMKETYTRLHEGDHRCSEEQVKRMMAEQVEDSRDDKILTGFDFTDIDMDSLKAYKNLFAVAKPQHPWLELDLFELFKKLGGWRKDRQAGVEGITLAGVLMFGTWEAIQDAVPNYFVDYRERDEASVERWIDRVYPDGSWSGNVFDFYRRTYRKLVTDLKVPFELQDGIRLDDSKAHEAIREALVNTLVHADYTGRSSILIVKRPDLFGFRNPGLMRVPPEIAVKGGESDCRNRRMHQMFLMIGAGERAGSGIPKIYSGWEWAKWRTPKLYEKYEPSEQTLLELSTASLIPEEVTQLLAVMFGNSFYSLNELEQMIVVTAAIEGWVNHERACQLTSKHSRDVTLTLPRLVDKGFLVASGEKRDKSYSLPGMEPPSPEDVFSNALTPTSNLTHNVDSLTHKVNNLTHNDNNTDDTSDVRDSKGRFISALIDKPFIDSLEALSEVFRQQLNALGAPAREQHRLDTETMKSLIIALCRGHYISVSVLEMLLARKPQSLRQNYLKPLVSKGLLKMAFPNKPNSPKQGYTSTDE